MTPNTSANLNVVPSRYRIPKGPEAAETFERFRIKIHNATARDPPPNAPTSNEEYDRVLEYCDKHMALAAKQVFHKRRVNAVIPGLIPEQRPNTPDMQRLGGVKNDIGRITRAIAENRREALFTQTPRLQAVLLSARVKSPVVNNDHRVLIPARKETRAK
jgi:hypothetical protein